MPETHQENECFGQRRLLHRILQPDLLILLGYLVLMLVASPNLVWHTKQFDDLDEGQHFYALDRLYRGQTPYANFYYIYGPSLLYSLYIPYSILGHNLASTLFSVRVYAPVVSLFLVFLTGRMALRSPYFRFLLMSAILVANAHTLFWCPGYRLWLNLLAVIGIAKGLFKEAGFSNVIWGLALAIGLSMSADMMVMDSVCLAFATIYALASRGRKPVMRPLLYSICAALVGSLVIWAKILIRGGAKPALLFNSALLAGTNWYGGHPLPWPWEAFNKQYGIIFSVLKIYGYFALLLVTILIVCKWAWHRRSGAEAQIAACAAGLIGASLVIARIVLGRTSRTDIWRLSYAAAPLFVLITIFAESYWRQTQEVSGRLVRAGIRSVASRHVAMLTTSVLILAALGVSYQPLLSVREAMDATQKWFNTRTDTGPAFTSVPGICCRLGLEPNFWLAYEPTCSYLKKHLSPGAGLYISPWGPHNALLNAPNPTQVDILENVLPSPFLRNEMIADLTHAKPEYIVARQGLSFSNNPELETREIRRFTEQYYSEVAHFSEDTIWRLKQNPDPPFQPQVVGRWTGTEIPFRYESCTPHGNLIEGIGSKAIFIAEFAPGYFADTVELQISLSYGPLLRSLAKNSLSLRITPGEQLMEAAIPTDGQANKIRFYLGHEVSLRQVQFTLLHPGPFNFAPKSAEIVNLTFYRTGGRAFD